MPERTAYKTDANGNVVPFTYIAPAQPDPMAEQQKLIDQAYRDLPLEQAEQAAMAAMVYQGQRGYSRDIQNGLSAPEALSKWAPLMFARTPGQGASMVRANPMQQQPRVMDIPGGGKMLLYGNSMQVIRPEPGISANTQASLDQRNKEFQYRQQQDAEKAKQPKREYLSPNDQALLNADVQELRSLENQRRQIVPQQPNWASKGNLGLLKGLDDQMQALRQRIESYGKTSAKPETPPASVPAAPTITESVKRFTFDPKTRKLIAK